MLAKKCHFLSSTYWQVRKLYHSAFPPQERPPYFLLWLFSLQPAIDFVAYYDEGNFVGLSYTVATSQGRFVLFLAVVDTYRSQGFGSAILREIAEQNQGEPCFLCMEPMDEAADNYAQRLKRLAFYEKNGYRRQFALYHELDETYEILATADGLDYEKIEKELNRVSLGLLRIRVEEYN